jgi:hypothetical protein
LFSQLFNIPIEGFFIACTPRLFTPARPERIYFEAGILAETILFC